MRQIATHEANDVGSKLAHAWTSVNNEDASDLRQLHINGLGLDLNGVYDAMLEQVTVALIFLLLKEILKLSLFW